MSVCLLQLLTESWTSAPAELMCGNMHSALLFDAAPCTHPNFPACFASQAR